MNSAQVISFISLTFILILSSRLRLGLQSKAIAGLYMLSNSLARTNSENAHRDLVARIHRSLAFLKSVRLQCNQI